MRLTTAQVSRAQYYDRNPLIVVAHYEAVSVAPAGTTVRASYTVPAGRKAFCQYLDLLLRRSGVATTANLATANVVYTPNGGSASTFSQAWDLQNVAWVQSPSNHLWGIGIGAMNPGDAIQLSTRDLSTAGTYDFFLTAFLDEFDA